MEPVSTVVAVVEAFKEVYLLTKFVYESAKSASHFQEEEKSLVAEFEIELLHLRSFWTIFIRADGSLIEDNILNQVSCAYSGLQISNTAGIHQRLI